MPVATKTIVQALRIVASGVAHCPEAKDACMQAADRLEELEAANAKLVEAMTGVLNAMDDLISDSEGVYGLHRNGDVAPWDSLLVGGYYEEWLLPLEKARAALALAKGEV